MKCKIAILTALVIILNCVFCYADNTTVNISDVNYEHIFGDNVEYDEDSDTYYFIQPGQGRVGAVAVTGSALSAILALAVKSGLEFATSNSMGEFLNKLFMVDGITGIISQIEDVVSNSVGGVLNFSRSLLDSIKSSYAQVMAQNTGSAYYRGNKFLTVTSKPSSTLARYVFDTVKPVAVLTNDVATSITSSKPYEYVSNLKWLSDGGYLKIKAYPGSSGGMQVEVYDTQYQETYIARVVVNGAPRNYQYSFHPYIRTVGTARYLEILIAQQNINGYYYASGTALTNSKNLDSSSIGGTFVNPTIGEAWSDNIAGNDGTADSDLSIKIPSDTNILIGKNPSDVTDSPTYKPWTPGVTITVPEIDTGSDDVIDTPGYDVIPSPGDTDSPGDSDTGTDVPDSGGSSSISWDWLKELLNKLLEMIQTIIDWLTNFWTNLLEFIKSLFVPDENYFVDEFSNVTEKLEEKIPSVDINKLEDLAVNEFAFEDIYADFFGVRCLVVRGSVINNVISWARPIIQGLIALFLLLFNYNQIYFLIRGTSLLGSSNTLGNMNNNKIGGKK